MEAIVRRGVRLGLYSEGDPTTQFGGDADENLFKWIIYNEQHVLRRFDNLYSPVFKTSGKYEKRKRKLN